MQQGIQNQQVPLNLISELFHRLRLDKSPLEFLCNTPVWDVFHLWPQTWLEFGNYGQESLDRLLDLPNLFTNVTTKGRVSTNYGQGLQGFECMPQVSKKGHSLAVMGWRPRSIVKCFYGFDDNNKCLSDVTRGPAKGHCVCLSLAVLGHGGWGS